MRNVLISGADRGLGFELTKGFLEQGDRVFAGRYLTHWGALDELHSQYTDLLQLVHLDVSSDQSVIEAAEEVRLKTDSIDVLINNAAVLGSYGGSVYDKIDFDDMQHVINVNAIGPVRLMNAMIDLVMNSFHKLIVNISTEAASIGTCWRYEGLAYCMSKVALNMASAIVHNSLHRERNGQVLLLHPGGMSTLMGSGADPDSAPLKMPTEKSFLTPDRSARSIIELINDQERFKSDHPAFVNYRGDKIPW